MIVLDFAEVRLLHQHTAQDALELQFMIELKAVGRQLEKAQILFRGEDGSRPLVEAGSGDAFGEKLRYFLCRCGVDHAIEGHNTTECGNRVAREGP